MLNEYGNAVELVCCYGEPAEDQPNMAAAGENVPVSEKNMTRSCNRKAKRKRNRKNANKASTNESVFPKIGDGLHCGWFWQNYYNALEWSERHQIAYWRSRSVALEYENNLLHQYVQSILDSESSAAIRKNEVNYRPKCQPQKLQEVESESEEDEQFEFQVNEEMMQFFEKSIRHKMEREKQREIEKKQSELEYECTNPPKQIGLERLEDMRRIYGKAAPMIIGMEAAMQITFNRNCDVHQPKLWPIVPLNM